MSLLTTLNQQSYCPSVILSRESESLWRSNDIMSLVICIGTALGYFLSVYWENVIVPPLFYTDEVQLQRTIAELKKQAAEYDTTSTIHLRSRIQRKLLTLREEHNKLRKRRYDYTLHLTSPNEPLLSRVLERAAAARRGIESGSWYRRLYNSSFASPLSKQDDKRCYHKQGEEITKNNNNNTNAKPSSNNVYDSLEAQAAAYADKRTTHDKTANDNKTSICKDVNVTHNIHEHHVLHKLKAYIHFWFVFFNYNLPHLVMYLLRYGTLLFILISYGNKSEIVCYPSTFISRQIPWMITNVFFGLFSLAIYGPFATSADTTATAASTINTSAAPVSKVMSINNFTNNNIDSKNSIVWSSVDCDKRSVVTDSQNVVCCNVLWWFILCTVAIWFTRRVFR